MKENNFKKRIELACGSGKRAYLCTRFGGQLSVR